MTIFKKIIDREIPAQILFEDDLCLAIQDIQPLAPVHILIIPKKEIRSMNEATPEDQKLLGHLLLVARDLAQKNNLSKDGYRLVFNTNAYAGQTVFHLHLHLLGGEKLGPIA